MIWGAHFLLQKPKTIEKGNLTILAAIDEPSSNYITCSDIKHTFQNIGLIKQHFLHVPRNFQKKITLWFFLVYFVHRETA